MDLKARLTLHTVALREDGAFSALLWDGRPFAVSVERTFDSGRPVISSGYFACLRSFYNKGGYPTFEIIVPGHSRVLFHKGNTEKDSLGCICVAESFSFVDGVTAVADSRGGFAEFMNLVEGLDAFGMEVIGR